MQTTRPSLQTGFHGAPQLQSGIFTIQVPDNLEDGQVARIVYDGLRAWRQRIGSSAMARGSEAVHVHIPDWLSDDEAEAYILDELRRRYSEQNLGSVGSAVVEAGGGDFRVAIPPTMGDVDAVDYVMTLYDRWRQGVLAASQEKHSLAEVLTATPARSARLGQEVRARYGPIVEVEGEGKNTSVGPRDNEAFRIVIPHGMSHADATTYVYQELQRRRHGGLLRGSVEEECVGSVTVPEGMSNEYAAKKVADQLATGHRPQ
eukprot:tig00020629_g12356.t1